MNQLHIAKQLCAWCPMTCLVRHHVSHMLHSMLRSYVTLLFTLIILLIDGVRHLLAGKEHNHLKHN